MTGPCAHAPDPRAAEVADQLRRARVAREGRDPVEADMHLQRADAIATEMAAEAMAAASQAPACEIHGLPMLPSGHTFVCPACQAASAAEQASPGGLALDDPPTLAKAADLVRAGLDRLGPSPYYQAVRAEDDKLHAVLAAISADYDAGLLTAREAADNRVAAHLLHAETTRQLRIALLGSDDA